MVTIVTWQPSCIILDTCCLSGSGDGHVSRAPLSENTHPWGQARWAGEGREQRASRVCENPKWNRLAQSSHVFQNWE